MKSAATVASMGLAVAALVVGLFAARYWWKASKIEIDPGWNGGRSGDTRPCEPADLEGNATRDGWLYATIQAATQGADLNKTAAKLTAYAVVLAGLSSLAGAIVNFF